MSTKFLISEEIEKELRELGKMELGSDEYKTTVDGVTKLTDRVIELEKLKIDELDKEERRNMDYDVKHRQLKEEKVDRIVKNCLTGLSLATSVGLAVWGTVVSMKFEKEDSFTSLLGRKWVDKTIPSFLKK